MQFPAFYRRSILTGALFLLGSVAGPTLAASNQFCGGPATPSDPSDLANVVGDMTLEHTAQQPASMLTCAQGYLLAKCGDFETANKVFDKCIAAGYVGSMIWKALMLEDGTGTPRDLAEAARLMKRAANSGDPAYAPLGKMHYATMLHLGKGIAKDEAEARRWFESAAADGNPEAREFLRTGYHTGEREQNTLGAGTPPPGALVRGLTGDNASQPHHRRDQTPPALSPAFAYATPTTPTAEASPPPVSPVAIAETTQLPAEPPVVQPEGQRLTQVPAAPQATLSPESTWMGLLILFAFFAGLLGRPHTSRPLQPLSGEHA